MRFQLFTSTASFFQFRKKLQLRLRLTKPQSNLFSNISPVLCTSYDDHTIDSKEIIQQLVRASSYFSVLVTHNDNCQCPTFKTGKISSLKNQVQILSVFLCFPLLQFSFLATTKANPRQKKHVPKDGAFDGDRNTEAE